MSTVMTARPRVNPRAKPPRSVRLVEAPEAWLNDGEGRLIITEGHVSTVYYFRELACQLAGRAFHVRKGRSHNERTHVSEDHAEEYDCRVHTSHDCNCECMGVLRRSHCKHCGVLAELIAAGKLPGNHEATVTAKPVQTAQVVKPVPPSSRYRSLGDYAANDPVGYRDMMFDPYYCR